MKTEWHIFVDGILAGFGGQIGCSLGFYTTISPAVALLQNNQAIVINWNSPREKATIPNENAKSIEVALYRVFDNAP